MSEKQPQAGEWWEKDGTRVCVIGTKKNRLTVGEMQSGTLIPFLPIHGWQHLPDCDSWTWQHLPDCDSWTCKHLPDCDSWTRQHLPDCDSWTWQPAADLPPVESPDEYRILREDEQTVATDQRMYPDGYRSWTAMTAMDGWESGMTVKELRAKFISWNNVVVRRKVVPPQPQPKRVPVRLWVSHRLESEHGDWPMRCTPASEEFDDGGRSPWLEIRHDGYKFYVEVQQ